MEDMTRDYLGGIKKRAVQVMKDRNMTAAEFSSFFNTGQEPEEFIERWLYQTPYMSLRKGLILADIIDVSVDYLFLGTGASYQRSKLSSPQLNEEEEELIHKFRILSLKQQLELLHMLKAWVPQSAFCSINIFPKGDFTGTVDFGGVEEKISLALRVFGKKLKACIIKKGLKMKEVSEGAGIDRLLLAKCCKGEYIISIEKLIDICKFLKVYPSDLIYFHIVPQKIVGLEEMESRLISYYRMLSPEEKAKIIAFSWIQWLGPR